MALMEFEITEVKIMDVEDALSSRHLSVRNERCRILGVLWAFRKC
jgi:hypothetical protein